MEAGVGVGDIAGVGERDVERDIEVVMICEVGALEVTTSGVEEGKRVVVMALVKGVKIGMEDSGGAATEEDRITVEVGVTERLLVGDSRFEVVGVLDKAMLVLGSSLAIDDVAFSTDVLVETTIDRD